MGYVVCVCVYGVCGVYRVSVCVCKVWVCMCVYGVCGVCVYVVCGGNVFMYGCVCVGMCVYGWWWWQWWLVWLRSWMSLSLSSLFLILSPYWTGAALGGL